MAAEAGAVSGSDGEGETFGPHWPSAAACGIQPLQNYPAQNARRAHQLLLKQVEKGVAWAGSWRLEYQRDESLFYLRARCLKCGALNKPSNMTRTHSEHKCTKQAAAEASNARKRKAQGAQGARGGGSGRAGGGGGGAAALRGRRQN